MKIRVAFSVPRGIDLISSAVKFAQGTEYSHVCVVFNDSVFQASFGKGVYLQDRKEFRRLNRTVKSFTVEIEESMFYSYIESVLGKPYSATQALGLGLKVVLSRFGINISNPVRNKSESYVCSEVVADILSLVGIKYSISIDSVSPPDIFKSLS